MNLKTEIYLILFFILFGFLIETIYKILNLIFKLKINLKILENLFDLLYWILVIYLLNDFFKINLKNDLSKYLILFFLFGYFLAYIYLDQFIKDNIYYFYAIISFILKVILFPIFCIKQLKKWFKNPNKHGIIKKMEE